MRTFKLTKGNLLMMIMFLSTSCFMAQAQQKGSEDTWAKRRSQQYKKELSLTNEQTDKVYEVLFESSKKATGIRESTTGDAQKKAMQQNAQERKNKVFEILTPQQIKDLKELWSRELRKGSNSQQENVRQKENSSNVTSNKWAKTRSQQYQKELGLSDEQADKVYKEIAAGAERAKEIRENTTGDVQKKALWKNGDELNKRIFEILTPRQVEDLKELWRKEANK